MSLKKDPVMMRHFTACIGISLPAGRALHSFREATPEFTNDALDALCKSVKAEDPHLFNRTFDMSSWKQFMAKHFDDCDKKLLENVFSAFDEDQSGVVAVREFFHGFGQVLSRSPEAQAEFVFGTLRAAASCWRLPVGGFAPR